VALQAVREDVARATENYELTRDIVRSEAKSFGERLERAVKAAEESTEILDRDRITLGLIALAGAERDMVLERFHERVISSRLSERMLTEADRMIEATRSAGRSGYRRAARRSLGFGARFRLAVLLYNRLRFSMPLARLTADRFESLLAQRLVLRDLHRFLDTRIRRIHGRRVAELLHDLLQQRLNGAEQALDGLRLQYPGYAEELERRFIRRTALRFEEREYETLRSEGLIGDELHADLMRRLNGLRAHDERRPKLDIALQKAQLARQFPLFTELDTRTLRRLGRALVTRYASPGEVLVQPDTEPGAVYFIATGAVELRTAGQTWRLGRGEMFGQMSILRKRPLRSEVRAITPCTLLALDEQRFLRLLRRSPAVREAVRDSARKRGLSTDILKDLDAA